MGDLQIRVLGEFAVWRDATQLALPQSRKTRALLAYLALHNGPHRRERLCEILWQVPDDPRAALRWSLSKIRGLVNDAGTERIVADRERVAFDPQGARVDLIEARNSVAAGIEGLTLEALMALARTLEGDCLCGLDLDGQPEFHYFLAAERQRTAELRLAVLQALAGRYPEDPIGAVPWLRALVELDPFTITHHRRLIEALAAAGRLKEAERQQAVSLATLRQAGAVDEASLQRAGRARPAVVATQTPGASTDAIEQSVRFCSARDGVRIAWASTGTGDPLVKTANWLNHLEHDWESPVWRHVFRGLANGRRLVRYDARGNGLSDWDTGDLSFAAMVTDLEAVVDAAQLERFPLLGISQGCAVSVEYAARHPERVSRLVLLGGYARGWNRLGSSRVAQQAEAMMVLMRIGWGQNNPAFRQMFTSMFMPDAPPENQDWFNELQRLTTSSDNAVRLVRALGEVDVRDSLGRVRAPTLVVHCRGDSIVPLNAGRELAGGIPGARFVSLDSSNHLLPASDPGWLRALAEIDAFLAED